MFNKTNQQTGGIGRGKNLKGAGVYGVVWNWAGSSSLAWANCVGLRTNRKKMMKPSLFQRSIRSWRVLPKYVRTEISLDLIKAVRQEWSNVSKQLFREVFEKIPQVKVGGKPGDADNQSALTEKVLLELNWKSNNGIEEMCRDQCNWAINGMIPHQTQYNSKS